MRRRWRPATAHTSKAITVMAYQTFSRAANDNGLLPVFQNISGPPNRVDKL